MTPSPSRSLLIDLLKVVGSQLIVLHHLSIYAPMGEPLAQAWPRTVDLLADDARLAVQVFLVVGGYLAGRSLARPKGTLGRLLLQRYLRLVPPLAAALALVLAATALVPAAQRPDWISPWPTPWTLLAHLLLLQDVLGIPSLSAGAWYVAIDLQLFALTALVATQAQRVPGPLARGPAAWIVAAATLASTWVFSRDADLDAWAPYFIAPYGLGVLAAWSRQGRRVTLLFGAVVALQLLDVAIEPRARPLLAVATAVALWAAADVRARETRLTRALARGSEISYALFVSHFAVIVVATAAWIRMEMSGLTAAIAAALLAWILATVIASVLHRVVPVPGHRSRTS